MDYSNVDHRRMRQWVGKAVMKNPDNGDLTFNVEANGFDRGEALSEINNSLQKYRDEGYTIHSIKIATDETPLLTGDEVLEQLKNEGVPVA